MLAALAVDKLPPFRAGKQAVGLVDILAEAKGIAPDSFSFDLGKKRIPGHGRAPLPTTEVGAPRLSNH